MTDDPRRRAGLRTALAVFERYGYRKTSMDDIAREIGLSRQGLYLWYPSKKALFAAAIDEWMRAVREEVDAALVQDGPDALVAALDALHGRFLDSDAFHREELLHAAKPLIGDRWNDLMEGVAARFAARLPSPSEQRAQLLIAASLGTKHEVPSRAHYRERMALAVRLLARPDEPSAQAP